jgi:cytidine deaminase
MKAPLRRPLPPALRQTLLAAARSAARQAHCPYSHFPVGAALLADDGRIFTGANVENASYGLTVCAERVALFQAVHAGVRRFVALALCAGDRTAATPCGACRQTLAEFCDDSLAVWCVPARGNRVTATTLGALLPHAFRLSHHAPTTKSCHNPEQP